MASTLDDGAKGDTLKTRITALIHKQEALTREHQRLWLRLDSLGKGQLDLITDMARMREEIVKINAKLDAL